LTFESEDPIIQCNNTEGPGGGLISDLISMGKISGFLDPLRAPAAGQGLLPEIKEERMADWKKIIGWAGILVLALAMGQAWAGPKVKIGTVPMAYTLHFDFLSTFGKEEGIDIEVIDFKSSSDENQAIAAGSLDGGNVGALGTNVLFTKGVPVVIVCGTVRGGSDFVVGKQINSVRDLQGKKIGATKGATSEILAKYQLKKAGTTATWINLPHAQLAVALVQKEVDAIAAGEPWAGLAVSKGIGKRLPGFNVYDSPAREVSGAFVVSQKLIKENPETVQKLVNAFVKAIHFANAKREDYIKHAMGKIKIPEEDVRIALKNAEITYKISAEEWPALANMAKDLGYIQDVADYSKAFNLTFLEKATK
jgi:NitT/TauT family transport system substrate-binding protein